MAKEPKRWLIEVYLASRHVTPRMIRGDVLWFYRNERAEWQQSPLLMQYAQVASPGAVVSHDLSLPAEGALPFQVDPAINDDDLVGIVDLIRKPISAADSARLGQQACLTPAAARVVTDLRVSTMYKVVATTSGNCSFVLDKKNDEWVIVAQGTRKVVF